MDNQFNEEIKPGLVVLFGSGETSPSGRKVLDIVLRQLPSSPEIVLLETPAGFELNSDKVIGRVAEFFKHRLQSYNPQVSIIPARNRGTEFSPDNAEIVAPILSADLIFMGPGSPTYVVRQLKSSLAWDYILARHRLGAAICLASAATIAFSKYCLPVYEIYKVGEELHWKEGLDFFGKHNFPLLFIPHWNNQDGGVELDTSRCFMGKSRFKELMAMLPDHLTVFGIDENTALIFDMQSETGRVNGLGDVTMIHTGHRHRISDISSVERELQGVAEQRNSHVHVYHSGDEFPLSEYFPFEFPDGSEGLPEEVWEKALEVQAHSDKAKHVEISETPQPAVLELVEARQIARAKQEWEQADRLRDQIYSLGWEIRDTPEAITIVRKA